MSRHPAALRSITALLESREGEAEPLVFKAGADVLIDRALAAVPTEDRAAGVAEVKDPSSCTVFALYSLFATPEARAELSDRYAHGGYGYGDAKKALAALIEAHFADARARKARIHPDDVAAALHAGAARARPLARAVLDRARRAAGLTA